MSFSLNPDILYFTIPIISLLNYIKFYLLATIRILIIIYPDVKIMFSICTQFVHSICTYIHKMGLLSIICKLIHSSTELIFVKTRSYNLDFLYM